MAGPHSTRQFQNAAVRLARQYPKQALIVLGIIALIAIGYYIYTRWPKSPPPSAGDAQPATALLCFWNVENFYDDHDHPNIRDDMEDWFGSDSGAFGEKVDRLADALLKMNDGTGPDIACLCEVENERCLEAIRDALNARVGEGKYTHILFKGDNTGRHFAPAILTRLQVAADCTRKLGTRYNGRILEGHLYSNGHELIVIVAHWTSHFTDEKDDGRRRMSYANDCYGRVNAILHENPDADVVVCGDFNDEFNDRSVREGLRASDNPNEVRGSRNNPKLLDLFANWSGDPPGTIRHERQWYLFDHVCVARGLLDDRGWFCDVKSAQIFGPEAMRRKFRDGDFEPLRFGTRNSKNQRGYSDHFPVTVQLGVAGSR
jgi:endonuclease/exonuclease/phosphatase family metal-dependent hydrolase